MKKTQEEEDEMLKTKEGVNHQIQVEEEQEKKFPTVADAGQKRKQWKEAVTQAVQQLMKEKHESIEDNKLMSFVDVVQAAAAFDRDGRIHMDFEDDDDSYDISGLQEKAKKCEDMSMRATRQSSRADYDAPVMTICLMIVGTHGDVQPFVAIAKRLILDGHRVRLATHAVYRDFVMSHGIEFYPLAGDPKELSAYMVKTRGHLIPLNVEAIQKDVPRNMQMVEEILYSTWPAVAEADPDGGGPGIPGKPFRAQAIISNPVTYGHIHVAERLGVPLHIMFPQPWVPTTAFPHPLSNMAYTGKPKKVNYLSYKMVDLLMWQGTEGMINAFRRDKLDLRKIRKGDGGRNLLLDLAIPHAFMWSPHIVQKPNDWGDIYDVIGTVLLEGQSSAYNPTPELEAFLGQDAGPIFVGFGSMVIQDPVDVTTMIIEAAARAKVRVLIQSSWSDMAGNLTIPDNIFFLGSCPHDWLMPRVSAVVHHGGAGTTAAGLLAGKPTFIVPFFGDQPFWGRAVFDAGVGVNPCPISQLTTEKLQAAFEALESPQLRARASAMRDLMQQEDGTGEAVRCFYRNLPLHHMRCDLDCGRAATMWSQKNKIRLCDECEFVVTSRPENSPMDIVEYSYVDYSPRGPVNVLEGAFSGVGALAHVFGSGFKDIIVKPAQGYREEGAKGAVIGLVKGLGGFAISPFVSTLVFADHLATGAYNNVQADDKKGSLIVDNKKLLNALGFKTRNNIHNGSMSADEVIDTNDQLSPQISIQLTPEEKTKLEERFHALVKERTLSKQDSFKLAKNSSSSLVSSESTQDDAAMVSNVDGSAFSGSDSFHTTFGNGGKVGEALHQAEVQELAAEAHREEETQMKRMESLNSEPLPTMSICMMTTGSWEESVQQYVAIGLRLKADGHCVRIATNSGHRDRIVSAGLDFYPLGGSSITTGNFLRYLYQRTQDEPHHKSRLLNFAHAKLNNWRESFPELDDLRELVFSLWPACVDVDPLVPGKAFRADAIIAHPYLFGQTIVATRLGVPLHCMSYNPQTRTQAFPHLISANMKLHRPYRYTPTNAASYDAFDNVLWNGMRDVLDEFRYFLGLTGKSIANNLLAEWHIPHTYLWNSVLLSKPHDWGNEITIAGYVELEESHPEDTNLAAIEQELRSFAADAADTPLIYFRFQCGDWDLRRVQDLVSTLEKAAQKANVRIVFQGYENNNDDAAAAFFVGGTDVVFEIDQHFPVKRILPHVHATMHWGDLSITSTCLSAGKPACVVPRNITQRMWGQALVLAGAGVEPLEMDALTPTNLVHVFRVLLDPKLADCAMRLAPKFSSSAIETAVSAFYSNLPLEGMTCDLDPARIARVYDSTHEMKLSYEARLVVHQITKDGGSAGDLKYKPLKYSQDQPPRFSLRELELLHSASSGSLKKHPRTKILYTYDPTNEELAARVDHERASLTSSPSPTQSIVTKKFGGTPYKRCSELSRVQSMALSVVEMPKFWDSPEEQAEKTFEINAKYEKLLSARNLGNRSSSSSVAL